MHREMDLVDAAPIAARPVTGRREKESGMI